MHLIPLKKLVFTLAPAALMMALMAALITLAHAHKAHEHGAAKVNIAVDGSQVNIALESPLDNLLPFEHSPVTLEQRKQVKDMAIRMHRETLFQLTPAAECRLEKVTLASEVFDAALLDPNISLDPDRADDEKGQSSKEGHGDLDAEFFFVCGKPENLNSVGILLFSAWPKMERIRVQAITPRGQRSASLTPRRNQMKW